MKGRTYTIEDMQVTVSPVLHEPPTLQDLQKAAGGYIESVPHFISYWTDEDRKYVSCIAYCNENGKRDGLKFNGRATLNWDTALRRIKRADGEPAFLSGLMDMQGQPTDVLCGPIIVVVGDEEFMQAHMLDGDVDEDGDPVPPDDDWWMYGDGVFVPACQPPQFNLNVVEGEGV
jgi:hypothetical protein